MQTTPIPDKPSDVQNKLCLLVDGELPADELGALLDAMESDPDTQIVWTTHQSVAAAMRGESVDGLSGDAAFWQKLQTRLQPVHTLPRAPAFAETTASSQSRLPSTRPAANQAQWRIGRGASLLVLVMGVLFTWVWGPVQPDNVPLAGSSLANTPLLMNGEAVQQTILRDPALDALMAAHQQLGGHSAWQAPSGFLRNATYERGGP